MIKTVADYLDRAADICPEKVAFVDAARSITYGDIQKEAQHVAMGLIRRSLFKKPIAVFLDKSVSCISAFCGIIYSGNFYTLLDTEMPETRIQRILDVLNPEYVITDEAHKEECLKFMKEDKILYYQDFANDEIDAVSLHAVQERTLETDVMYVLFTSGSTGVPKGVVTPHRAVVNYLEAWTKAYEISDTSIVGNQAPFYFVMSITDIFGTMAKQATMHMIPKTHFMFPALLVKYINENQINTLSWVPSALCLLSKTKALGLVDLSCIRTVIFGGEVMPVKQLKEWQKHIPNATYINGYGPTEVTDGCTYYIVNREFEDHEVLPLGVPFANTDILVLDDDNHAVTSGSGELCIRSDSMTYGYYQDPVKTAEVFVQNPLNPYYNEIIYRTGDLVQFNAYGELEYIGRKDFQIKHMGRRIELGEIEANISAISGILENCCLYDTQKQRIVLYYTGEIEDQVLAEQIKNLLPAYMTPKKRVKLEQMPHNLNGKIDRAALKQL